MGAILGGLKGGEGMVVDADSKGVWGVSSDGGREFDTAIGHQGAPEGTPFRFLEARGGGVKGW